MADINEIYDEIVALNNLASDPAEDEYLISSSEQLQEVAPQVERMVVICVPTNGYVETSEFKAAMMAD
ncbi:hypothetical protein GGH91_004378, partial [Coemansia sp. RSA 2671]